MAAVEIRIIVFPSQCPDAIRERIAGLFPRATMSEAEGRRKPCGLDKEAAGHGRGSGLVRRGCPRLRSAAEACCCIVRAELLSQRIKEVGREARTSGKNRLHQKFSKMEILPTARLINGITLGSIYGLIAIGYTMWCSASLA